MIAVLPTFWGMAATPFFNLIVRDESGEFVSVSITGDDLAPFNIAVRA